MDVRTIEDGTTVYVARDEGEHASKGPFFRAYRDENRESPYGYLCSNCGTLDNAMDTMGRIVCNVCENTRKPELWDAAHE